MSSKFRVICNKCGYIDGEIDEKGRLRRVPRLPETCPVCRQGNLVIQEIE